jgi:hypothetical protein
MIEAVGGATLEEELPDGRIMSLLCNGFVFIAWGFLGNSMADSSPELLSWYISGFSAAEWYPV